MTSPKRPAIPEAAVAHLDVGSGTLEVGAGHAYDQRDDVAAVAAPATPTPPTATE